MPKPPPRLSSGTSPPASSSACSSSSARGRLARSPPVPKICEPMWQCRPEEGQARRARGCARRAPAASVEREAELLVLVRGGQEVVGLGVHAAVDAQRARPARAPRALDDRRRRRSISISAVDDDRADADRRPRARVSATLLLLPWKPRRAGSAPAASATASSPPRAHVDREALVGHPARDLGAEERLAGVVDRRACTPMRRDRGAEGGRACGGACSRTSSSSTTYSGVPKRSAQLAWPETPADAQARRRRRDRRVPARRPAASAFASAGTAGANPGRARWTADNGRTNRGKDASARLLRAGPGLSGGCRGSGALTRRAVLRSLGHGICRTRPYAPARTRPSGAQSHAPVSCSAGSSTIARSIVEVGDELVARRPRSL